MAGFRPDLAAALGFIQNMQAQQRASRPAPPEHMGTPLTFDPTYAARVNGFNTPMSGNTPYDQSQYWNPPAPAPKKSSGGGGGNPFSDLFGGSKAFGGIGKSILTGLRYGDAAVMSSADQLLKLAREASGPLGPKAPHGGPSGYDWLSNISHTDQQLSGGDVLKNQGWKLPSGPGVGDVLNKALAGLSPHPSHPILPQVPSGPGVGDVGNAALGAAVQIGANPLTYVGAGAGGAGEAANTIVDAAKAEIAPLDAVANADKIAKIQEEAGNAIHAVQRGGASALTKEEAARWGVQRGLAIRIPGLGGESVPITTGGGPLGALSVARHEAQSALSRLLLGGVDETGTGAPTALGRLFGGKDAGELAAAVRGSEGGTNSLLQQVLKSAGTTAKLQTGQIGQTAAKSRLAQALADAGFGAPAETTAPLAENAQLGRVAQSQAAATDAAAQAQQARAAVPQATAGDPATTQVQTELAAQRAAAAHQNPQAEAQSLSHPAGASPAAPQGAPSPVSPAPSANAAQGATEALPNTVGVPPSPQQQTLQEALAAAQAEPGNAEKVQAAVDAAHAKIQAVKGTLESNPGVKGAARYTTPYKVQLWAHARDLGIDTKMSAPRLEQTLKDAVSGWQAGHDISSPAFDEARTLADTQKAVAQTTPEQSQANLQSYADQLAKKMPNAGDAHGMVAKADTQVDQVGLAAKDPTYDPTQNAATNAAIHSELAAPGVTPERAQQLTQIQQELHAWGAVEQSATDPAIAEVARLNQVALRLGVTADQAAGSASRERAFYTKLLNNPESANNATQQMYRQALDFAHYREMSPGIMTPNHVADVADTIGQMRDLTNDPNPLIRMFTKLGQDRGLLGRLNQGFKTQQLGHPGFLGRLVFGHGFMHVLDRGSPESVLAAGRILAGDSMGLDPAVIADMKSLAGMGFAKTESGLSEDAPRLIPGHTMPWENKYVQAVNPLSTRGPLARMTVKGADSIQQQFRLAMAYDHMILRGESLDAAAAAITKFHFNYSDLSQAEKGIQKVIPFYTFLRNNVPLQVQQLTENPKIAAIYLRAKDQIQGDTKNNPLAPGALLDMAAHPLVAGLSAITGGGQGPAGNISPWITGPIDYGMQRAVHNSNAANPVASAKLPILGWRSGKPVDASLLHWPSFVNNAAKMLGVAHVDKTTGKTFYDASTIFAIQKALPLVASIERSTSDEPRYKTYRNANILSLFTGLTIPREAVSPADTARFAKYAAKDAAKGARAQAHALDPNVSLFPPRRSFKRPVGFGPLRTPRSPR